MIDRLSRRYWLLNNLQMIQKEVVFHKNFKENFQFPRGIVGNILKTKEGRSKVNETTGR